MEGLLDGALSDIVPPAAPAMEMPLAVLFGAGRAGAEGLVFAAPTNDMLEGDFTSAWPAPLCTVLFLYGSIDIQLRLRVLFERKQFHRDVETYQNMQSRCGRTVMLSFITFCRFRVHSSLDVLSCL